MCKGSEVNNDKSGIVYYLRDDSEIVYVGCSRNKTTYFKRLLDHSVKKTFNGSSFRFVDRMLATETREILKYKPKYNTTTSSNEDYFSLSALVSELSSILKDKFSDENIKGKYFFENDSAKEIISYMKAYKKP